MTAKITYSPMRQAGWTAVFVDGRKRGNIRPAKQGGFLYAPLGSKLTGAIFATVDDVKRSVEGED